MLYMHDVWVNWFEGEENGYNVAEFHEWRKSDSVELLDTVPLLKVSDELFDYIENDASVIQKELLTAIFNKAYLRKNHERKQLDYAFVITNGKDALAVDTIGYDIPLRKSRLIPRQLELSLEMTEGRKDDFTYEGEEKREKYYSNLNPKPELMVGLTRREKQLKQLLLMVIDEIESEKHFEKLKYLYTELNPHEYKKLNNFNFEELMGKFIESVSKGWNENHEAVLKIGIKGKPFFEKIYEMENVVQVQ